MLPTKAHMPEIVRLQRVAEIAAQNPQLFKHTQMGPAAYEDVEGLQRELIALRSSKSWRLTAPLRWMVRFIKSPVTGLHGEIGVDSIADAQVLKAQLNGLRTSISWRITAPLRFIKRRMGYR